MQLRAWASALIFISSYSPLALIILVQDIEPCSISIDLRSLRLEHPIVSIVMLIGAILSVILILLTMTLIKQGDSVRITKVTNQSGQLVNYTIPYLITFLGFDLGDIRFVVAFLIFMTLMYALTVRTQNIFINPVLALAGYGLYDVEYRENGTPKQSSFLVQGDLHPGDRCRVRSVSRFLNVVTRINPTV